MSQSWLTYGTATLGTANGCGLMYDSSASMLPAFTMRLRYGAGVTPTFSKGFAVQVSSDPNIWDFTYMDPDWNHLLHYHSVLEVVDSNLSGVTNIGDLFENCNQLTKVKLVETSGVRAMFGLFYGCQSLTEVNLFDTSACVMMPNMFCYCYSLTSIPLFDTGNVSDMDGMFKFCTGLVNIPLLDTSRVTTCNEMCYGCFNVESGALALYNQMSSQSSPPTRHTNTFSSCGSDTVTGAAELAQIPASWGGTMQ